MEILLIVLFLVVVLGGTAWFVTQRRGGATTLEPPPAPKAEAPPVQPPVLEGERDVAAPSPPVVEEAPVVEEEVPPAPVEEAPVVEVPPVKPSFRDRLSKARSTIAGYVGSVLSRDKIDEETWDELEEALIRADVGVATTTDILERLRATVKEQSITDPEILLEALKAQLKADLSQGDRTLRYEPGAPNVWLFVGVNGVGKTTTIGKLAHRFVAAGKRVVIGAADTFRAAAIEQLQAWGQRTGATVIAQQAGADPAAVAFDAAAAAMARGADVLMVDTAGRLQTRANLMQELSKVHRVLVRQLGRPLDEVLLVLDATTGQNGLSQARLFSEAVPVTGIALTKLDGTAKGGIVIAIAEELKLPVKLVGVGEQVDDLQDFDPEAFVEALFA